jgi:hypothetical protein
LRFFVRSLTRRDTDFLQHVALGLRSLLQLLIPEVPADVDVKQQREEYLSRQALLSLNSEAPKPT